MASLKQIAEADSGTLPPAELAKSFYDGTVALGKFVRETVHPLLSKLIAPSDRELAFSGAFYRMCAWIDSLVRLGHEGIQFQGVAAATRGLFELLMDIKLLEKDVTGEAVAKYMAHIEVDRFRMAQRLVDWKTAHPGATRYSDKHARDKVNAPGNAGRCEAKVIKYWGTTGKGKPNWPEHWTSKSVRGRAEELGDDFMEMYLYFYAITSADLHAGFSGQGGFKAETYLAKVALFHSHAQEFFSEALTITAAAVKLDKAIAEFRTLVQEAGLATGLSIVSSLTKRIDAEAAP